MAGNTDNIVITPAIEAQIIAKLEEIEALVPGLISLTPGDRKSMHKMGNVYVSYVQSALTHAVQHLPLVPNYLVIPRFQNRVNLTTSTSAIISKLDDLKNGLEDTNMLAGAEAIADAGTFYDAVKLAAKKNVPNAKAIVADLKANFIKTPKAVLPIITETPVETPVVIPPEE